MTVTRRHDVDVVSHSERRPPTPFAARFPELAKLAERVERDQWFHALGWRAGYEYGRRAGIEEERTAWNRIMGVYRETVARPTMAEVRQRRGETDAP
jgi:hypothetical protein